MRRLPILLLSCASAALLGAPGADPPLDRPAAKWVEQALARMTPREKAGQLLMPGMDSTFVPTDSAAFDRLRGLVERVRPAGFLVFGGTEAVPPVLLNPTYNAVTLGDPLSAASTLNRLQRLSPVPLLNAGDFEFGLGMRMRAATTFPRAMAFGAARDERLAEEAGRMIAREMRAIGVHVNFAPVADVNNNPKNPVINTRSFGEDAAAVGRLAAAFARGLQRGGVIATLKHFPGHGDTDVDTHLGLATVPHPRERLDAIELAPFRLGISAGAGAVMVGHLEVPAIDTAPGTPATLSRPAIETLLRRDLGFTGLVVTDSMLMQAVAKMGEPGENAVRALLAGNDLVLHPPDDEKAFDGVRGAIESGRIPIEQVDRSVRRVLEAKARMGLHTRRTIDLDEVAAVVGSRAHQALAATVAERALTLVRDERSLVPLTMAREASVLVLSLLDYSSGWRAGAPGRTFIPELKARWPGVTAIELSDRSSAAEVELVRAAAARHDAVVAAVFVRAASASGRMELSPELGRLLRALARADRPLVACLFGNPYVAASLPDVPALLLTYDFGDAAERAAARALTGEAAISGRLPIALPGLAAVGHGLERP